MTIATMLGPVTASLLETRMPMRMTCRPGRGDSLGHHRV